MTNWKLSPALNPSVIKACTSWQNAGKIFRFRLHTDEFFPIYVGANWEATESVPISRLPHLIVKQRPYLLAILPRTSHPIKLTERHRATTIPVWRQRLEPFHSNTASTRRRGVYIPDKDTISLAKWAKAFDRLITLAQLFLFLISLSLLCPLKRDGGPCQMDLYVLHTHKRVALQTINHTCGHIGLSEKRLQGLAV